MIYDLKSRNVWANSEPEDRCGASLIREYALCVCREQELKVYQARRSLEDALMADGVARAAENTRELLEGKAA